MKQRVFVFAPDRCFGCLGCTAACVQANGTPAGVLWREVLKIPPEDGDHRTAWLSSACNHCEDAPCVKACPTGAMRKRGADGVVRLRERLCIGCSYCLLACPYEAIRFDVRRGVVSKCSFCADRLDAGREPACVETCFAGALGQRVIDTEDEPEDLAREAPGFAPVTGARASIRFARGPARTLPAPPAAGDAEGGRP
jgi:Fe-S-cluster-containing dehydrogenase component